MNDIQLKQGEQKILKFLYKDSSTKTIIDLTGCTFKLVIKNDSIQVTKNDSDFDKTHLSSGIVKVLLTSSDLDLNEGLYKVAIMAIFPNGEIDKSITFSLNIIESIIE